MYSYEGTKTQFATFDDSTGTLRFWNRETVPSVGDKDPEGHNVDNVFTEIDKPIDWDNPSFAFHSIASNIKVVTAVDRVSFVHAVNMFAECHSLATIDLSNFDTSNTTSMTGMFYNCSSLTTLDLSSFDTRNVISMSYMFCGCSSLATLGLSNFNTSKVIDMSWMFFGCSKLITANLSNFDTSNVTNMNNTLGQCPELVLDCSHWNVDKVTEHVNFNKYSSNVIPPAWKN